MESIFNKIQKSKADFIQKNKYAKFSNLRSSQIQDLACTECRNPDTYLKEQVQQSKEEPTTKESPGFNKYGQFYGFD